MTYNFYVGYILDPNARPDEYTAAADWCNNRDYRSINYLDDGQYIIVDTTPSLVDMQAQTLQSLNFIWHSFLETEILFGDGISFSCDREFVLELLLISATKKESDVAFTVLDAEGNETILPFSQLPLLLDTIKNNYHNCRVAYLATKNYITNATDINQLIGFDVETHLLNGVSNI